MVIIAQHYCTQAETAQTSCKICIMARNAGQRGGFLCLSSALIQHSKWRIYINYVLRNKPYFLISARLKNYISP